MQLELTCQSPKPLLIAKIYNGRGHIYLHQKDLENAAQNYTNAVEISFKNLTPRSEYYQNLGHVYLKSAKHEKAIEALEKAIQIEHDSSSLDALMMAKLYTAIGHGYFSLKNYTNAVDSYRKAFDAYEYLSTVKSDLNYIGKNADKEALLYLNKTLLNTVDNHESIAQLYQKILESSFSQSKEIGKSAELISTVDQSYDDFVITEEYEGLIEACTKNKEFDNALEICKKVVEIKLSHLPKNNKSLAIIYITMSRICYQMKNYQFTTVYIEKYLELTLAVLPADASAILTLYQELENDMCINKNYEEALHLCNRVLAVELTRQPQILINIALMHRDIGRISYLMKEYETAFTNFKCAIDILTPCLPEQKNHVIRFLEDLQFTYSQSDNFGQAIECCTKLLALNVAWDPDNLLSLAKEYSELASLNFDKGNYQTSIENWEKVVEIHRKLSPVDHNLITQIYIEMARACSKHNNDGHVLTYYERAIENEQNSASPTVSSIAHFYNEIGNIHHVRADYKLSMISYTQAIKILSGNGNIDPVYFENLALSYKMLEKYDEAIENYTQALEIKLKCIPIEPLTIAKSYAYLGSIYFNKENYQTSIDYYEKAIQMSTSVNPMPESLISWYGELSEVNYTCNDLEKAYSNCESALQNGKLVPNLDPLILIEIYRHIFFINYLKYDHETALSWGQKLLEMYLTHLQPNDDMIGIAFNDIGKVLCRMGIYNESLINYRKALEIYSKSTPGSNYSSGDTYRNIGELFEINYQFNEAAKNYEKSIEFLSMQQPLPSDFYLFYIKIVPNPTRFYVLKHLTIVRNLIDVQLE